MLSYSGFCFVGTMKYSDGGVYIGEYADEMRNGKVMRNKNRLSNLVFYLFVILFLPFQIL